VPVPVVVVVSFTLSDNINAIYMPIKMGGLVL